MPSYYREAATTTGFFAAPIYSTKPSLASSVHAVCMGSPHDVACPVPDPKVGTKNVE